MSLSRKVTGPNTNHPKHAYARRACALKDS
jgi:hypothetical protein